ncbi:hypothetical protein ILUMI_17162 [Ignelater luminosus]|uniref:Uncharacterized protein n=1 Tax=Ignelater luminosus TaxID=2038154 RepID=A0A8K0CNV0_IGNLU|nr:hypothetical protein ILUMI_17162 [Ignelater luminosus]
MTLAWKIETFRGELEISQRMKHAAKARCDKLKIDDEEWVSQEDTMKVWETFYSKKFEQEANMENPRVEQELNNEQQRREEEHLEDITMKEIEQAVGKIKIGKAEFEEDTKGDTEGQEENCRQEKGMQSGTCDQMNQEKKK